MDYRYGFIGCGNMGGTLVSVAVSAVGGSTVCVFDRDEQKTAELEKKLGVKLLSATELGEKSKYIVLGVKPQILPQVCQEIKNLSEDKIIVSMAAGVKIERVREYLGGFQGGVIRIMPNTPCGVGAGIIGYTPSNVSLKDEEDFVSDFRNAGKVNRVEEKDMDAVCAVSGSGPAFVYMFAEGMIEGAKASGMTDEQARTYAIQTLLGGATMLLNGEDPAVLRKKVCSPNGTTLEGVRELVKGNLIDDVSAAVQAACQRSKELSGK